MVSPGLQDWSPVPEGNSEQGLDTGAEVLTRPGLVARRISLRFFRDFGLKVWLKLVENDMFSGEHPQKNNTFE